MNKQNKFMRGLQILGVIILIIFISMIDFQEIKDAILMLNLITILELLILMIFLVMLKGLRWKFLIKSLTGINIPLFFASISIICGVAAGSLIPGRLELAKPLMLKNHYDISLKKSTSGMLLERLTDIQSIVILFIISLIYLLYSGHIIHSYYIIILFVFPIMLLSLYFYPKKIHKIIIGICARLPLKKKKKDPIISFTDEIFNCIEQISNKEISSILILTSIGCMLLEVFRFFIILKTLNIDISFPEVSFVFFASVLIGIISLIPGGIGIYELSSTELVKTFSDYENVNVIQSGILIERIIAYYSLVILGGVMISSHRYFLGGEEIC